jgi:hypothetical protein
MLMKRFAISFCGAVCLLAAASTASAENLCGWLENPTPGNWWLTDKDGPWIIMAQGSYEAQGMDMIGDISAHDYVATNGNYGYGCACMDVMTDPDNKKITMIHSFEQLSLAKCENDGALPRPGQ